MFLLGGVIASVIGIIYSIPAFMNLNYTLAILTTFLWVGGLVLIGIAFED